MSKSRGSHGKVYIGGQYLGELAEPFVLDPQNEPTPPSVPELRRLFELACGLRLALRRPGPRVSMSREEAEELCQFLFDSLRLAEREVR